MDKLLKEAIADAKAVRETALANAKIALEEAFAPKLQSMLAAKINEEEDEMEDEEETTDEGTGMGIDYLGEKEYGEEEEMGEAKDEEEGESEEEESEEETDESLDLEAIIRELEMEAKEEGEEEVEEAKEDEEEINLDELLAALSEEEGGEDEEEKMDEAKEEDEEEKMDEAKKKEEMEEIARLKSELAEYRDAVVFLKDKINEINLLNAKLLYTNKLFKSHSLTEAQKVKILESLDRTKTVREVKLVYSTLAESLTETSGKTKSKIAESFGFASKKSGNTQKAIIEEGSTLANRFQTLANINKKK